MSVLRIDDRSPFHKLIGVGGVGSGIFFALQGNQTLGRNESRPAELLASRDYCKLHIIMHYVARLLGSGPHGSPFSVLPVARVGDDAAGNTVLREMSEVGIDTRCVRKTAGRPTVFSVCFQYPDGSGGNITTSNSAASELTVGEMNEIGPELATHAESTMALAVPEVSLAVRRAFLEIATRAGCFRVASFVSEEITESVNSGVFGMIDLVALNEEEAERLTGVAFDPGAGASFTCATLGWLKCNYPKLRIVISAGRHGAYAFHQNRWGYCPAPKVDVKSTAGAGDALLAGILAGLAAGLPFFCSDKRLTGGDVPGSKTALELGVLLASFKVQSQHTIHPEASLHSLLDFAARSGVDADSGLAGLVQT